MILAAGEVFWCVHNIQSWTDCFRLVSYLPFERIHDLGRRPVGGFSITSVTDLHLIMALVKVNEGSCNVSTFFHFFHNIFGTFLDNLLRNENAGNFAQGRDSKVSANFCRGSGLVRNGGRGGRRPCQQGGQAGRIKIITVLFFVNNTLVIFSII